MADNEDEGHSGWTIDQISGITDASLQALKPNVVTLLAGTNDLAQGGDPATAAAKLGTLMDKILDSDPNVRIAVAQIPVSSDGGLAAREVTFNQAVDQLRIARSSRVAIADTSDLQQSDMADTLHPNDSGYHKLGDDFAAAIDTLVLTDNVKAPTAPSSSCPADGGRWFHIGQVASGVGGQYDARQFPDLNGDGRADYVAIGDHGQLDAYLNGGPDPGAPGGWIWYHQGEIASGLGPRNEIQFGDIDGDGRDDYLVVSPNGAVKVAFNGGPNPNAPGGWNWYPQDTPLATGVGIAVGTDGTALINHQLQFADMNGDGRDDYNVVGLDGTVRTWINTGRQTGNGPWWGWWEPFPINASGAGPQGYYPLLRKFDCDHRADYLRLDPNGPIEDYNGGGFDNTHWIWYPRHQITTGQIAPLGGRIDLADLDGDGRDDYYIVGANGSLDVYLNKGGDPA